MIRIDQYIFHGSDRVEYTPSWTELGSMERVAELIMGRVAGRGHSDGSRTSVTVTWTPDLRGIVACHVEMIGGYCRNAYVFTFTEL